MHQYNPIRALRARRLNAIAALEKYFDTNPLGQKTAQHILKGKEIFAELRQRLRKRLADYIKNVQDEN
ncbi:unnamed protein product [Dibothriocephalus latus]|uniref:Uncharacterized protein n=1 Tax=Dibothriocephalus latus TaxID=60516 RepID=A0A3P7NR54_DIBLA|nr:unnamed protein product [Dibothriocephalus latus]